MIIPPFRIKFPYYVICKCSNLQTDTKINAEFQPLLSKRILILFYEGIVVK